MYALIYTNLTTHAIRFIDVFHTRADAKRAMKREAEAFYCSAPWRIEMGELSALVLCKEPQFGYEYKHGKYEVIHQV